MTRGGGQETRPCSAAKKLNDTDIITHYSDYSMPAATLYLNNADPCSVGEAGDEHLCPKWCQLAEHALRSCAHFLQRLEEPPVRAWYTHYVVRRSNQREVLGCTKKGVTEAARLGFTSCRDPTWVLS